MNRKNNNSLSKTYQYQCVSKDQLRYKRSNQSKIINDNEFHYFI